MRRWNEKVNRIPCNWGANAHSVYNYSKFVAVLCIVTYPTAPVQIVPSARASALDLALVDIPFSNGETVTRCIVLSQLPQGSNTCLSSCVIVCLVLFVVGIQGVGLTGGAKRHLSSLSTAKNKQGKLLLETRDLETTGRQAVAGRQVATVQFHESVLCPEPSSRSTTANNKHEYRCCLRIVRSPSGKR